MQGDFLQVLNNSQQTAVIYSRRETHNVSPQNHPIPRLVSIFWPQHRDELGSLTKLRRHRSECGVAKQRKSVETVIREDKTVHMLEG